MDSLFIVMPAYNEETNIEAVISQWYPILSGKNIKSRLVVADSGSTDHTHEILINLQDKLKQLEILSDTERQHGPKIIALYDYAIKQGADYIFQTDSDGQTNPDEFEEFWKLRKSYAGIFGYRKIRGDGKDRAFVEKTVCFLLKLYFGIKVPDANAPFRLMRADTVKKYLYMLPPDYNIPNIMITTYFSYFKENMTFKIISFKPRQGGINSINFLRICRIGKQALKDFRRFKKEMKGYRHEHKQ